MGCGQVDYFFKLLGYIINVVKGKAPEFSQPATRLLGGEVPPRLLQDAGRGVT